MIDKATIEPFKWLVLETPCGCRVHVPINNETEKSQSDRLDLFQCGHGEYKRDQMAVVE